MQAALCTPLGLHDRLMGTASDVSARTEPPVRAEVGHPQVGAIPGHAGPVPGQPGKAATVGAGAGGGVEVMPAGKHPWVGRPIGGERHQLVDYLATLMTFPHTNQQLSSPHDSQVGIAQTGGSRRHGSDRDWPEVLIHPVQTLVPWLQANSTVPAGK
jgi:hypothetical protein